MRLAITFLFAAVLFGQRVTNPTNQRAAVTISASAKLQSGTYTSGITATGTTGQTCALTALNGAGSGATATVALTGTNAIAGGTALVVTAAGSGYTSAPTSATAGNGTATCSGTAVIATAISVSVSGAGFYLDNLAGALTYVLPTITNANVGSQFCFRQSPTRAGIITLQAPASTFIDQNGTNGSAAGTYVSGGAAGDAVCLAAISTTQYMAYPTRGTWTNN